jgi:hypothetical protein
MRKELVTQLMRSSGRRKNARFGGVLVSGELVASSWSAMKIVLFNWFVCSLPNASARSFG